MTGCLGLIVCCFFAGLLVGAAGILEWIAVRFVRWYLSKPDVKRAGIGGKRG